MGGDEVSTWFRRIARVAAHVRKTCIWKYKHIYIYIHIYTYCVCLLVSICTYVDNTDICLSVGLPGCLAGYAHIYTHIHTDKKSSKSQNNNKTTNNNSHNNSNKSNDNNNLMLTILCRMTYKASKLFVPRARTRTCARVVCVCVCRLAAFTNSVEPQLLKRPEKTTLTTEKLAQS